MNATDPHDQYLLIWVENGAVGLLAFIGVLLIALRESRNAADPYRLIAQGVIGGDQPNAADFQIATSVRLLMVFDQLLPLIAGRPAEALARKVVPEFNGRIPAALPPEWVPAPTPA